MDNDVVFPSFLHRLNLRSLPVISVLHSQYVRVTGEETLDILKCLCIFEFVGVPERKAVLQLAVDEETFLKEILSRGGTADMMKDSRGTDRSSP